MGRNQLGSLRCLVYSKFSTWCSSPCWPSVGVSAPIEDALVCPKTNGVQTGYSYEFSSLTDDCNSHHYALSNSPIFGKFSLNVLKCYPLPAVYISFQNAANFQMQGNVDQNRKLKGFLEIRHLSATVQSLERPRVNTQSVDSLSVMQGVQVDIEARHFVGNESVSLSGVKGKADNEKENIEDSVKLAGSNHIVSPTQSPVQFRDPAGLYQDLLTATQSVKQTSQELQHLADIFMCFSKRGWAADQALALYINASFFPTAVSKFKMFFTNRCPQDVLEFLMRSAPSKETDYFLFPIFAEFCMEEFPDEIARYRTLVQSADLTNPHLWFPFTRAMRRKIIYHCGPTNSGKTYCALQKFMEAKSGIYCGPLRLLAMEVFDKVNACGVSCSLHTGQEKKDLPFANHVACTIEMASTVDHYEVAVIDEIQMIGDEFRGFAWTRSLLGLKADEIHLCGDPSVISLIRCICAITGDDLTEKHYERFKPVVVEAKSLQGNFQNFQPGDCVVAFSRREIFEVKLAIERFTKHRCCVIYGALPPETRKQQANLFNNPDNEYDVLVASDAVGMGLNLNIRRVVFYGVKKYNGDKMQHVPASQVKQIAGRAGRRGSRYPEGLTTAFLTEDLQYLLECLQQPFEETKRAGLFPFFDQIEVFAAQLPDISFSKLLDKFSENSHLDISYFLCRHDHIKKVAQMLDKVPGLSLQERYNFCFAPVNISDHRAMDALLKFAFAYGKNLSVRLAMGIPRGSARSDMELLDLEARHQILSMYLWLSQHFREETFPSKEAAEHMATIIADLLGQSLVKVCWKPESRLREMRIPGGNAAVARPG